MSLNNLTMLSLAPNEMAGRAMSLMNFGRGMIPVGGLVAGALADAIGARNGLLVMGAVAIVVSLTFFLFMPAVRSLGNGSDRQVRESEEASVSREAVSAGEPKTGAGRD